MNIIMDASNVSEFTASIAAFSAKAVLRLLEVETGHHVYVVSEDKGAFYKQAFCDLLDSTQEGIGKKLDLSENQKFLLIGLTNISLLFWLDGYEAFFVSKEEAKKKKGVRFSLFEQDELEGRSYFDKIECFGEIFCRLFFATGIELKRSANLEPRSKSKKKKKGSKQKEKLEPSSKTSKTNELDKICYTAEMINDLDLGLESDLSVLSEALRAAWMDLFEGKEDTIWNRFLMNSLSVGMMANLPDVSEAFSQRKEKDGE